MYMDKVPQRDELEFSKMRYTAITCDPNDFVVGLSFSTRNGFRVLMCRMIDIH